MEWQVMPFVEEHPVAMALLGPGIMLALSLIATLIHDGPAEFARAIELLALAFGWIALLPFAWWAGDWDIRHHRQRLHRMRANQICTHCGYDLRATPDRCPECGRRNDEPADRA
jgi:hypothetical protein